MGQFSTRPEEPTEWAGLPSEPARVRPRAESLDSPVESAASLTLWGSEIASVTVPIPTAPAADAGPESAREERVGEDSREPAPGASASTFDSTPRTGGA
jgi:hypothetical protein